MTVKASILVNGSTLDDRPYGYSESWEVGTLLPDTAYAKISAVALARSRMFSDGSGVFGYRLQLGNGAAYTVPDDRLTFPANNGPPNIPNDAFLVRVFGSTDGTKRTFWIHDVPDDWVTGGKIDNAPVRNRIVTEYLQVCAANDMGFSYQVQTAPKAPIMSIDVNGNVVLSAALAGAAFGVEVQLFHVRGVDGRGKRGIFRIGTFTDTSHFQLAHWPGDIIAASGSLRLVQKAFTGIKVPPIDDRVQWPIVRAGSRKCGRPFGLLRGRATAKR